MTTAELIALLREADPDGTTPVCVGNADVYFVQRLPAYYDGRLQQLVHDESKKPYWTIVGAKIITAGEKIDIVPMSICDVLMDMPELPIEGGDPTMIEAWRAEARDNAATFAMMSTAEDEAKARLEAAIQEDREARKYVRE
jgi:hypothetical protein